MRNYSQEVARAATQRTRDLDDKGNNHVLLIRWNHPILINGRKGALNVCEDKFPRLFTGTRVEGKFDDNVGAEI